MFYPTLAANIQSIVTNICHQDQVGSHALGRLGYQIADGSRAKDNNFLAFHRTGLANGMYSNCQRLYHGSLIIVHIIGQLEHLFGIYCKVFCRHARCLKAHDFKVITNMIITMPAGIALAAADLGLDGDLVADLETLYTASELCYSSRNLVPLYYWIGSVGVETMINVNVRSADTNA